MKKLTLALGGGSARGFAHVGVLKVLQEEGIPVHSIAGCSMGSLLGGIYASGCAIDKLYDFARVFQQSRYLDIRFTKIGYIKGEKVQKLIKMMTKNLSFDQVEIPFTCTATCIETCELEEFHEGVLHEAIRCSISLPGIFQPHQIGERTYVDGGVIDRTAISAARGMGGDVVVAVDVGYRGEYEAAPGDVIGLLQRSVAISLWQLAKHNLQNADFVLAPQLSGIESGKYTNIDPIIQAGERAAREALPQIRALLEA